MLIGTRKSLLCEIPVKIALLLCCWAAGAHAQAVSGNGEAVAAFARSVTGQAQSPSVSTSPAIVINQKHYQWPVLVHKPNNPVLRVKISLPADAPAVVCTGLQFSFARSAAWKDIKKVKLFYAGREGKPEDLNNTDRLTLAGSSEHIAQEIQLNTQLTLAAGDHYFWLAVELHKEVNLLDVINVNVVGATVDGKAVKCDEPVYFPMRLGYAVRQHKDDGADTYRIPGLTTANDGSLLAVYDIRRESGRDLQGNIDIGLSRSVDKGQTWLPMQVVIDMGKWGDLPEKFNGVSDACILTDKKTGHVFIAGLWMHGVLDSNGRWIEGLTDTSTAWNHQWRGKGSQPGFDVKQSAQFLIVQSKDNGKTWGQPVNLTAQCKKEGWWLWAPAPGAGITMRDGTLIFPTQGRDHKGRPFSNITYSKDGGHSWKVSGPALTRATTENMAVELSDGSVMLNMRSNTNRTDTGSTNGRAVAVTKDLGNTWSEHPSSHHALQEPTCMASIIRHGYTVKGQKRSVLLFANPDSKTARQRITIKVSYDDGNTWQEGKKLLLDEGRSRGYSCLTSIDEDTIGILYESSQADLVFQQVSLKELL